MLEFGIVLFYTIAIGFIFLFSLGQATLVYYYLKNKRKSAKNLPDKAVSADYEWPNVTVQLPVYNELYVVNRLIDAVCALDYPKDKLQIQLLDDSNDETVQMVSDKVNEYAKLGLNIKQIRRSDRIGYKAGALNNGMDEADGLIAIFDADFIPEPDFLKGTIPHFDNPKIGMVQTRWDHINLDYSLLTKVQGFGLDAHFSVEQQGRTTAGVFINFNGTAGVWRKKCIIDAGGWHYDTITEDLDLSYRAQLKGWEFKFLKDFGTPAELPAQMNAVKSQQFRWTKGAVETAKKMLFVVWKADIGLKLKVFSTLHLLNSYVFLCIFATGVLSVPLLMIKNHNPIYELYFQYSSVFLISFLIMIMFYLVSLSSRKGSFKASFKEFSYLFPLFMSVSMGMSFHNTVAVIQGIRGKKTPFIRTPKMNVMKIGDTFKSNKYLSGSINATTIIELGLAFYYLFGIYLGIKYHDYGLMPFHFMLFLGFGIISYFSFRHSNIFSSKSNAA
ncbi:MAG: cellulose synthase/poly-beta-1,6-N-acetylglucosamine synthase-like glycosyltransferase [Sphingobacteriales bacterium]|jgi:cellulose synthase/poly-beta-1,6-N-acetylglucosamine synthase-like glycosyltransferase